MALPSRSFDLNQANTLVQDFYLPGGVRDQYFLGNAIYYRMGRRRKIYEGGRAILASLSFAPEGGGGQWWAGADKLDTRYRDVITGAVYTRKNYSCPVVLMRDEEDQVRGPEMLVSLLTAKMNIARPTAIDAVGTELFNTGTDVRKIGGLGIAVKTDPTTGTYGNITTTSGANTWWQNQTDTTGTYATGASGSFAATRGFGPIGKMWATIGRASGKKPTIIISNWGCYQDYHDSLAGPGGAGSDMSGGQRYAQDPSLARAGFENVYYKMAPWVVDERAPHTAADLEDVFFLHEPAVNLVVHSARNMSWDAWREPTDQKLRVGYIDWSGEFVLTERRCHGVISAVDASATS